MRSTRRWPLVALAVLVLWAVPDRARADARDFPGALAAGARLNQVRRFDHNRFDLNRRPFRRPFVLVPNTIIYSPEFIYAPPPTVGSPPPMIYVPPPSYAPPAGYSGYYGAPPSAVAPPPAPTEPPEPHVVEFDSGRYELRGDGLREPYTWVWVPKAPTAPPGQASAPRRPATIYRWVDERGVTTLTDDPMKVPPQFRALELTPR
jgi:uncharacterized protein DUF4124